MFLHLENSRVMEIGGIFPINQVGLDLWLRQENLFQETLPCPLCLQCYSLYLLKLHETAYEYHLGSPSFSLRRPIKHYIKQGQ